LLAEIKQITRSTYVPASTIADIHVALGEFDLAMDYLERGVEERALVAMWLHSERRWDPLRSHPRFPALLASVGL
jgi:hypothetical protein